MTIKGDRIYYLVSDLHFEHPECNLAGIQIMCSRAEADNALFIVNGDWLDGYIRTVQSVRENPRWMRVIKRIEKRLLVYVIGNHDSMVKYTDWLIAKRRYPFMILSNGDEEWYIEHGHLAGKWRWLFAWLDTIDDKKIWRRVVRWALKQKFLARAGRSMEDNNFKDAIIKRAKFFGCSVVIAGHNHYQEIQTNESITYVNPGTALGDKVSYAVYKDGKFTLEFAQCGKV